MKNLRPTAESTMKSKRWNRLWTTLGLSASLVLGACSQEVVDPVERASGDELAPHDLVSISQALGPADGDFTECRETLRVEDFPNLPPDLEVVNGRLQLRTRTEARPDLWVANANDNTVTRINTETGARVQTYRTGTSPSRTAVDLNYDVFVANRAFGATGTVTKIDSECTCGSSTTAVCTTCQLWQVSLGNNVLPRGLAVDANNDVWVGLYNTRRIVKLDGETGAVLQTVNIGVNVYGLAIDREGLVWAPALYQSGGTYTGQLACFDPNRNESCGLFTWPRTSALPHPLYGVAVDVPGNVWLGSWDSKRLLYLDRASFDAQRAAGTAAASLAPTLRVFTPPSSPGNTRGVAADADGFIWLADSGRNRLYRFNPGLASFDMSIATCSGPIGVGLSDGGDVWTMCQNANQARAYDPDLYNPSSSAASLRYTTTVGSGPYSYSDFTGYALRNITAPTGTWSQVFDCGVEGCGFNWVDWDALLPANTAFRVQYRTSSNGTDWSAISPSYDVAPSGVPWPTPTPRYVEIILTLESSPAGETPQIENVVLWQCPEMNPPTFPALDARFIVSQAANNYGVRWAFTDNSWPELRFEAVDPGGLLRGTVNSTTDFQVGDRYSGASGATAGITETGHPSNTYIERAFRAARLLGDGTWERSGLSEWVRIYTSVNDPLEANGDLQFVTRARNELTVRWCRPQNNWAAGLTGATLEMSTSPTFNPVSPGYRAISTATDADRGYASPTAGCGNETITGLVEGTTYYFRLVYQNGDGVPSAPLVMSTQTFGATCCYLDICVGVCATAEIGPDGCIEPETYEGTEASCDGADNDCDGLIDEGLLNACGECGPLDPEICDGNDNDCDGGIDVDPIDGNVYFLDADGDGWGDPGTSIRACSQPPGYVPRARDCDDTNASINPGATDVCNYIDDNCNGLIDEDEPPQDYYSDRDGDGHGAGAARAFCEDTVGYSRLSDDCDDTRNTVYPGAPEICDSLDNDCDTVVDEGYLSANVTVGPVRPLDQVAGGRAVCSNSFTGAVCAANYAVDVTIANQGTIPGPATSTLTLYNPSNAILAGPMPIGEAVPVGGSITRTYCFGMYTATAPEDLRATLAGTETNSCRVFSGLRDDVVYGDGDEICDGRDNDCDVRTDESPDACGAVLDCVQPTPGNYICSGTLEDESAATPAPTPAPAGGAAAESAAAEPQAGCTAGRTAMPTPALGLALLALLVRRRRIAA